MKLYKSGDYYSKIMKDDYRNVFLVLSDTERTILQQKYVALVKAIIENCPKSFNHYDWDILEFIPRMFHYHPNREECQMLDPSITQLVKVDKMLNKMNIDNFVDWVGLHNEQNITRSQMKKEMNRKRKLKREFERRNIVKEGLTNEVIDFGV